MAAGFPLFIDLTGNNCTIFGGGKDTVRRAEALLAFGAKVTVISPSICPQLMNMRDAGRIRHIPRKYYRGDCSQSQLCVAATDEAKINIDIATECKSKGIPVNVTEPRVYGNFQFPRVIVWDGIVMSISGDIPAEKLRKLQKKLEDAVPEMMSEISAEKEKGIG